MSKCSARWPRRRRPLAACGSGKVTVMTSRSPAPWRSCQAASIVSAMLYKPASVASGSAAATDARATTSTAAAAAASTRFAMVP